MESSAEEQVGRDALIGEVLASRYRIEARLGGGGMGTVYRARHVKVGRPFAVKVMHRSLLADDRSRRRFQREAELAGTLRHANVVAVVDVGETPQGDRYIVMEFADGPPLTQLIEQGPIPGARMLRIAQQLCDGLEHAHERGMIHRDFKPDNIIVERDRDGAETPRIVDFGIAILRDEPEGGKHERLTTGGVVLGTPHCMAPEHACGEPIDHRIDLFALGVICFEMLTGRPPFDGDGVTVARANMMMETPPMGVRVPYLDVDPLLEAFTRKLMMKSRDARPPTAKAARDLLGLISRDRLAAAAALGVALASSNEPPASLAGAAGRRPGQDRAALAPETTRTAHPTELSLAARSPRKRLIAIGGAVCALAVTVAITMLVMQRSAGTSTAGSGAAPTAGLAAPLTTPASVTVPSPTVASAMATPAPTVATSASPTPAPNTSAPITPGPTMAASTSPTPASPSGTPPGTAPLRRAPSPGANNATATPPKRSATPVALAKTTPARSPSPSSSPSSSPSPTATQTTSGTGLVAGSGSATPEATPARPESEITSTSVAQLYGVVGRQLKALDQEHGSAATEDLWPLYLRIRINDVIATPIKRGQAAILLSHLQQQIVQRERDQAKHPAR